jgi:hypothetical protein
MEGKIIVRIREFERFNGRASVRRLDGRAPDAGLADLLKT